ncbi:hypothetical protein GMDG_02540 [Pseudogymnoascus destructans 20631-21]|uniref:Uncharacterized protein n=1 Tax=Pseudogymnoascus destructans (strain ATCC MYA-4855 / 20631-21) TaxID=658429 RepID=L8G2B1_PSED2|nr:hypothetical protein GMDG_02540 [Pseudogymnoascus destructans 20631-21]
MGDFMCLDSMAPNVLVFAGAPMPSSLDWEFDALIENFLPPIRQFAGLGYDAHPSPLPIASHEHVRWRSLRAATEPLVYSQLQAGASPGEDEGNVAAPAAANSALSSFGTDQSLFSAQQVDTQPLTTEYTEDVTSQFYGDSLAVYENLPSSAIPDRGPEDEILRPDAEAGTTASNATSFSTSLGFSFNSHSTAPSNLPVPDGGRINDLGYIPNSKYLHSIHPQTMTVNIIVGIISISPPRSIQTRGGSAVEIVELLVGDQTRSGFGINCWLPLNAVSRPTGGHPDLRRSLSGLRPQDIILVRNVALSSFRGKVYGQSLRREVTKVDLLFRNRIDREDEGGCYGVRDLNTTISNDTHPQVGKTIRVREWVLRFVGHGAGAIRRTDEGKVEVVDEKLPPDTQ